MYAALPPGAEQDALAAAPHSARIHVLVPERAAPSQTLLMERACCPHRQGVWGNRVSPQVVFLGRHEP